MLARLPEPLEPAADKLPYRQLAQRPGLWWQLALAAAGLAALAGWLLPEPKLLPVWVLIAAVGPLLSYVDWQTHLLPYRIVAPTWVLAWIAVAVSAAWLGDSQVLWHALLGNVIVFAAFWLLYLIAGWFFGGGFGYGDVRLSAILGIALGPLGFSATFAGVYAGFALGAVVGLVRQRGRLRGRAHVAFGPFMVVGSFLGLLFA